MKQGCGMSGFIFVIVNEWAMRKTLQQNQDHVPELKKNDLITVGGNEEAFTHLGAVLDKQGSTEADIKQRLALARNAFAPLLWKYQSTAIKLSWAFSTQHNTAYCMGQRCGVSQLQT